MRAELTRSSWRTSEALLATAGTAAAGILGYVAGNWGAAVLLLILAPASVLPILARPILGLLLLTAILPLENLVVLQQGVTGAKVLGMLVFGAWLLRKIVRRESWQSIFATGVFKAETLFVSFAFLSVAWAQYTSDAYRGLLTLGLLYFWGLMVLDLAGSWLRVRRIVAVLVLAAFAAALLTVAQYVTGGVRRAGEDIAGGINNTAAMLVTIVPLAFYLVRARQSSWPARLFGLGYVGLTVAAVAVTFSRMSFILLPLVILVQYWETIKGRTGRGWLILLTGVAVLAAAWLVPLDQVRARAETILPYVRSTVEAGDAGPTSGRAYHYRVGLAIFRDHPIAGAGYHNYGRLFLTYQYLVPGADRIWATPRSPHGSHIGILANLGAAGFAIWLVLLAVGLGNYAAAWSRLSRRGPSMQFVLVQAMTYSFVLQVIYAGYEVTHHEKLFWLLLATSAVVRRLTDHDRLARSAVAETGPSIVG